MTKKFFAILIILIITLSISSNLVSAKNDKNSDIPEENGIYDVPGHPDLKVRVFVHKANPSPSPQPELKCGLADPDSLFVVDSAGWKLPATFTYNLNPSSVPASVDSVNLFTIAENSFNVWENAISKKVNVVRGADTTAVRKGLDNKNIIAWGSISSSALGVTYIWYNPLTMQVRELDTIMNKKYVWMWSGGNSTCAYTNSYDAQNILTHEIGHWFGLDDEKDSVYQDATMYGYGSKMEVKKNTLTTGDISGIDLIY